MAERTVSYKLTADIGQFRAQMAQASASVKEAADRMTGATADGAKFRAGLNQLGGTAGKVGLVAAAGLAGAIKSTMDWETAWTGVLKTVDGSDRELAKLETGLRNLAVETGFAHAEVAAVAEAAGQLGISTGGIKDFTRTMLDMGVSTNLSSEEAATGLARLRNIMGGTEAEIRNTGSAMVELGNNFATTEAEILAMSQRLAGAGRQAGLSTADVLGLATAMSSVGIEAEAGGSAMSLTMKRIGKEVDDGGAKLSLFAETAGMSVAEFTQAWGEDAAGTLTRFVAGLGEAESMGKSTNQVLRELGVTGIRESDALLRLSANAEGLGEALGVASEGFEQNAALAEEAGKFYDTSAQQMKQSMAQIKDSAIDVGESMLPVVEGAAKSVAALAQAFQQLPGPIKGAVGPMAGITAILGGGLWFTAKAVSGVADMRQAMNDLGPSGTRAATAMGKVGKAAGVAAAGLAALAIVDSIQSDFDASAISVEGMTKALLDLEAANALPDNLKGIGDQIERLADPNWAQNLQTNIADVIGFGDSDELYEARATIEAIDASLSGLVQSGNAEAAGRQLELVLASLSDDQASKLLDMLPEYDEALLAVENDAKLAAESTDAFGNAAGAAGAEAAASAEQIQLSAEALKESREAATETATAFFNLGDSLNDAEVSLGGWITEMEKQAKALRDFRVNAEEAANKGLRNGLIAALQEAGPEGAMRLEQLANASEKEIKRANRAWGAGQREINKYTDAVGGVPDADLDVDDAEAKKKLRELMKQLEKYGLTREEATAALDDVASGKIKNVQGLIDKYGVTRAQARALLQDNASGAINGVRANLNALDGDRATVTITTVRETVQRFVRGLNPFGSADGSTVPKDGGPYADRYPYLLAPGEEVISNRNGQADRWRPLLKAINAGRLADGGTAAGLVKYPAGAPAAGFSVMGAQQALSSLALSANGASVALKSNAKQRAKQLEKQSREQEKELDALKEKLDLLRQERDAIRESIKSRFTDSAFGSTNREYPEWFTAEDRARHEMLSQRNKLTQDIAAAQKMTTLIGTLKSKGFTGGALSDLLQNGDVSTISAYAGLSKKQLNEFERLYEQRAQAASTAAKAASGALGLDAAVRAQLVEVKAQRGELRETNQHLKAVNRRLERLEKAASETGPKRTGEEVGKAINKSAGDAARRPK